MKSPKDPHLLSGAYALNAVSAEEAAAVEAAMRDSEELCGEVGELTDTAVELGLSVPPADPPPELRARLLDLVDVTPQLPPEPGAGEASERMPEGRHLAAGRSRRRRSVLLVAVAAVAVLLFGGGLAVDRMLQPPPQSSAFAQLVSAPDSHHSQAPVQGGGTATVYWSKSLNESAVVLNGVAQPVGRSLQMWVVTGGSAKSVGLYDPPSGDRYELMQGALRPDQRVAVTVEPAGGSQQPTTAPIVVVPA